MTYPRTVTRPPPPERRSRWIAVIAGALLAAWVATPVSATRIELPQGAALVAAGPAVAGSHRIATGPWRDGDLPSEDRTGRVATTVWTLAAQPSTSVASVAADIEAQLTRNGFRILLSCVDRDCGGFDFRRALDLGQSPEMHVDIGNFRYISAMGDDDAIAVAVSHGGETVYVHLASVTPAEAAAAIVQSTAPSEVEDADAPVAPRPDAPSMADLSRLGAVPLDDLGFRTGASDLSGRDYPSLAALAQFLSEVPARRVILVGHTDAEGGRESNLALSRARADAVRRHLIERLGVDPAQVEATGIGFLAPRATNETAEGREANRRVEVVLLDAG